MLIIGRADNQGSGGFLTKEINSLNCKNANQIPPAYKSSDEEFYHVVDQVSTITMLGVAGVGVVGALKNRVNVTN